MPTTTITAMTIPTMGPVLGQGSTRPGHAVARARGRPCTTVAPFPRHPRCGTLTPRVARAQPTTTAATGSHT